MLLRNVVAHIRGIRPARPASMSVLMRHSSSGENPYHPGRVLKIFFKPEPISQGENEHFRLRDLEVSNEMYHNWTEGFAPLTVAIVKTFTPFTSAVALMVKVLESAKDVQIPDNFILKLNDRRFGYRDENQHDLIWDPQVEERLREQIGRLLGPDRAGRRIPQIYYADPVDTDPDGDGPIPRWDGWELEIFVWTLKQKAYLRETLAYRHLRSLQGNCIPQLYGTVRLGISPTSTFLHPIVDFVSGLAIEHIPGPDMGDLTPGVDLAKPAAERVSRRLIDAVTRIRDLYCHHNDLRLPNIVLRNWPADPDPVVIDFGLASVISPDESKVYWGSGNDEVFGVRKMLTSPDNGDWHVASPHQQDYYERLAAVIGAQHVNAEIASLPDEVREAQFERIPGTGGADATTRVLQWRVRSGVRTQDDYLLHQPVPPDQADYYG